jgi:hypothetical protein
MFVVKEGEDVMSPFHAQSQSQGQCESQCESQSQPRERAPSAYLLKQQPLEDIIDAMPQGWFHTRLLLVCGLGFAANSMAVSLLSFVSVCVSLDWGLNDNQNASLIRYVCIYVCVYACMYACMPVC